MRAVIVDDEPELRKALHRMLAQLWPELEIIADIGDGDSAVEVINTMQPDIAFLDIQMPGRNGLEVALDTQGQCKVVFVTAYDQYAVDAFEREAVDYLLKPISEARLKKTIERLQQNPAEERRENLELLREQFIRVSQQISAKDTSSKLKWIKALKGETTLLIDVNSVLYFQAGDKYTTVVTLDGEYLIRKPIKELEQELDPENFWQVHRGTIAQVAMIESSQKELSGGYLLTLRGSQKVLKVSRNYGHLFKQM